MVNHMSIMHIIGCIHRYDDLQQTRIMSKKLAIKGHATRGKEVIELFKMMGGKICVDTNASVGYAYYIDMSNNMIICSNEKAVKHNLDKYKLFTLEEFLEKFPYKVGDKVNQPCRGCVKTITSMEWDEYLETVSYKLDNKIYTRIEQLKVVNDLPYKETNMKPNKCTYCVYAVNNNHCGLRGFRSNFNVNYCSAQNVDKLPNGFELQEDGYFSWVNKKSKYPTTYDECCDLLNADEFVEYELMTNFPKLINARNAYWKIAGEEMGLGKPWEPNWADAREVKYSIEPVYGSIDYTAIELRENRILVFPTDEMRTQFYYNFKDLIESCKELL